VKQVLARFIKYLKTKEPLAVETVQEGGHTWTKSDWIDLFLGIKLHLVFIVFNAELVGLVHVRPKLGK